MKVPCDICNKPSVDARDMTITGLPDIRGWCEDEFHKKQVNDSCDRFYAMLHPVTDTTQHDPRDEELARLQAHIRAIAEHHDSLTVWRDRHGEPEPDQYHTERRDFALSGLEGK